MENRNRPCGIFSGIFVLLTSGVLGILSTIFFVFGFLPYTVDVFLFTAALGALIAMKMFSTIYDCCAECCKRSLGSLTLLTSLFLTAFSLIALTFVCTPSSFVFIVYFWLLSTTFWISLLGFFAYYRCVLKND